MKITIQSKEYFVYLSEIYTYYASMIGLPALTKAQKREALMNHWLRTLNE